MKQKIKKLFIPSIHPFTYSPLYRERGFTLIEIAMVLVVIGILLTIGAGLVGILTKRGKLNESREIVKAVHESILGYVAMYKKLPNSLSDLSVRTTDPYMNTLEYYRANEFVANNLCIKLGTYLTVTDNTISPPSTKNNVAFIVFSKGENGLNNTGTGPFTINEYGVGDYDDIVQYTDIDTLRKQACTSFAITTESLPSGTEEFSYPSTTLEATDGTTPYAWSIISGALPPGLNLNSGTGVISGTPTQDGSYNFTVQVLDSDNPQRIATKSLAITIYPNKPRITTEFLSYGTENQAYPSTTLSVTGGLSPYTWTALGSPPLPTGLSMSNAGVISGTPTAAGTFSFTATVTDSRGRVATKTLSIAINPASVSNAPTCALTAVPSSISSGQTTTLAWSINNGPATGAWNIAPGGTCPSPVPSGNGGSCTTAAIGSTTTFVLTVTKDSNSSNCAATVTTSCPALTNTTSNPMAAGTVDVIYASNITYSGGQSPVSCSIASGSLPPGLSLVGCTIGGTPTTAGTYNFTTRVTDSCSPAQTSDAATSITINPAPCAALSNTTPNPLPAGTTCTAYSQNIIYAGGVAPVSCSISAGSLPTGLSLAGCTISGTPTTAANYNFTTRVTDSCAAPQISDAATSINITGCASYSLRNTSGPAARYYKRNGGACTTWNNNSDITVLSSDSYMIYSDNTCTNLYCTSAVTYCQQKPFDINGDCRTKMKAQCVFADR